MRPIQIKTIPHDKQRYETVGDYYTDTRGALQLRISDMCNPDYEFLVALHELIESHLVTQRGIAHKAIDDFDQQFEAERAKGTYGVMDEPGDDPQAPYFREHQFATIIEKFVALELGVDWKDYNVAVMSL